MDEVRLHAEDIAEQCVRKTGARRISRHAKEIALLALWLTETPPQDNIKQRIRNAFIERHPECGSVFIMIVLPILISVISQWIVKWLTTEQTAKIRVQAKSILFG